MATNQIATLGVKVDPRGAVTGANRAKRAITGIGNSARNVKNRIMSMQGALLGLGAGAVLKSIITTASSVESLQVRLKFLTGSTEEAAKAFETMNTFASKVPFSLEEIERASPLLLTVAKDASELNNLLEITGDIAAVSGLSFEATAGQLQRSMAGGIAAADLFRERGVKSFLGFKEGVQYSASETKKIIEDMFRNGTTTAKGATKELANTFTGQVSMMQDAWRKLKLAVADSGVFKLASEAVVKLTKLIADPIAIENAKKMGSSITSLGTAIGGVITEYMKLPKWVRDSGLLLALFGGVYGKATLVTLGLFSDKINNMRANMNLMFLETKRAIYNALVDERLALALKKKRNNAEEARLKELPELIENAAKRVRALTKRIYDLTHTSEDITIGFTTGFEIDSGRKTDLEPFQLKSMKAVTDFVPTYIEHMKKTADVNMWLAKVNAQISKDPRDGLPEHLMHTSDEADKVTSSFYRSTTATEIMGAEFDKLAEITKLAQEKTKEFADGMATNIEDSIMRMTQGLMSFKDVVGSVFQYVAAEMVRANIAKPLASSLSGILTGSADYGGKGDGGVLGSIFGSFLGKRATGGNVNAGQPYMVGERGAELFVPKGSGDIVPNNKMGGSTVVNVTYAPQVNALDPRTASTVLIENAPLIVGVIRQAFERNGQQVAL
mgnify:CR=1 FL=1|tara:strand:- start:4718 stop:6727 length:2010 start_codon:yes stop_codon:yes gene_type:complete